MEKHVDLCYGPVAIEWVLPDRADLLTITEPHPVASAAGFATDLDHALSAQQVGGCRIAVVVADKTRLCAYDRYLPILFHRLEAHGVQPDDLICYIAYGTHPPQTDDESRSAYGDVFSRYRFVHHDCDARNLFQELGRTSRGTPVRLRKDIRAADRLITFGAIAHHYFAGYGGGRKLMFPGLGQRSAIYHNHGLFLDRRRHTLAQGCRPGRLNNNPLAEDLAEIETFRPADLAIHAILDSRGRVCQLQVGSGDDHFRRACAEHAHNCERSVDRGYDLVVASCGGSPKDINFIQSHKAVHHAAGFVNDGGCLILLAQCPDGIGSATFLPWLEMGWQTAFDRLGSAYVGNGGTALAMMAKTRRIRICLVTDLADELCATIGVQKVTMDAAIQATRGHDGRLAVIPNASLLVRG